MKKPIRLITLALIVALLASAFVMVVGAAENENILAKATGINCVASGKTTVTKNVASNANEGLTYMYLEDNQDVRDANNVYVMIYPTTGDGWSAYTFPENVGFYVVDFDFCTGNNYYNGMTLWTCISDTSGYIENQFDSIKNNALVTKYGDEEVVVPLDTTPFAWHHMTMLYDIKNDVKVIYIDGEPVGMHNFLKAGKVPTKVTHTRLNLPGSIVNIDGLASMGIANPVGAVYKANENVTAMIEAGDSLAKIESTCNMGFVWNESYKVPASETLYTVGENKFDTFEQALIASNGATIDIRKSLKPTVTIDRECVVNTNGNTFNYVCPGFDCTVDGNVYTFTADAEGDTVTYIEHGKTVTKDYVSGTPYVTYNPSVPVYKDGDKAYGFTGWSLTEGGEIVTSFPTVVDDDITYYAVYAEGAFEKVGADGSLTHYPAGYALHTIVAEAASGDTIYLLADAELTSGGSLNKKLTIDINGFTLTAGAVRFSVTSNSCDLTFRNGNVANVGSNNFVYFDNYSAGAQSKVAFENIVIIKRNGNKFCELRCGTLSFNNVTFGKDADGNAVSHSVEFINAGYRLVGNESVITLNVKNSTLDFGAKSMIVASPHADEKKGYTLKVNIENSTLSTSATLISVADNTTAKAKTGVQVNVDSKSRLSASTYVSLGSGCNTANSFFELAEGAKVKHAYPNTSNVSVIIPEAMGYLGSNDSAGYFVVTSDYTVDNGLFTFVRSDGKTLYFHPSCPLSLALTASSSGTLYAKADLTLDKAITIGTTVVIEMQGHKFITIAGGKRINVNANTDVTFKNAKFVVNAGSEIVHIANASAKITVIDSEIVEAGRYFMELRGGTLTIDNLKVAEAAKGQRLISAVYRTFGKTVLNIKNSNLDLGNVVISGTPDASEKTGFQMEINIINSTITSTSGSYIFDINGGAGCADKCSVTINVDDATTINAAYIANIGANVKAGRSVNIPSTLFMSTLNGVDSYFGEAAIQQLKPIFGSFKEGTVVTLQNDLAFGEYNTQVEIGANVTLDLNGKTLTTGTKGTGRFSVNKNCSLIIKNGNVVIGGSNIANLTAATAVVRLENVKVSGGHSADVFDIRGGTIEVYKCDISGSSRFFVHFGYRSYEASALNRIVIEESSINLNNNTLIIGDPTTPGSNEKPGYTLQVEIIKSTINTTKTLISASCKDDRANQCSVTINIDGYSKIKAAADPILVNHVLSFANINVAEGAVFYNGFPNPANAVTSIPAGCTVATRASDGAKIVLKPTVTPKANLTLYADFNLNLWLPVNQGVTEIKVGDVIYKVADLESAEGMYKVVVGGIAANAAADDVTFYISYAEGEEVYTVTLNYSVVKYAASLLANTTASAESKALVASAVDYIGAAYTYAGTAAPEALAALMASENYTAAKADASHDEVAEVPATETNKGDIAAAISSAQLSLGSNLKLVLNLNASYTGALTLTYAGNTYTYTVEAGKVENATYVELDMRAYDLYDEVVTIVAGEYQGSYDLKAYAASDKVGEDANLEALVLALYNFCKEADEYKAIVNA